MKSGKSLLMKIKKVEYLEITLLCFNADIGRWLVKDGDEIYQTTPLFLKNILPALDIKIIQNVRDNDKNNLE